MVSEAEEDTEALLVLPGQLDIRSWLVPKERASAEALVVLPGQLDIRSWMLPKESAFGNAEDLAIAAAMEEHARSAAELADEDAARSMGLEFDLGPDGREPAIAEALRAGELAELAAAEELEELEKEAALALGLSLGIEEQEGEEAEDTGPAPQTPRRSSEPKKDASTPQLSKRPRRSEDETEDALAGKRPRSAVKPVEVDAIKDCGAETLPAAAWSAFAVVR